ncbi:hypothetical protein TrVE_jg13590 [Triparma verrucosa]|uniref:Uncharacterized protein n=2 Tax=Triparma TaxID=722752 RepID=A0A9W7EJ38_9STRA|nr:hypothetical protein TrST_g5367 [Triparma strigata]GMH94618.1 hypothetical protein TrVE_jg13590 [Triparma verrucosa]
MSRRHSASLTTATVYCIFILITFLTETQTFSTVALPATFSTTSRRSTSKLFNGDGDDPINAAINSLIPYIGDDSTRDSREGGNRDPESGTWGNLGDDVQLFTPKGYDDGAKDVVFLGGFVLGSSSRSFYDYFITRIGTVTKSRVLCVNYQKAGGQPLDHYEYAERAERIMEAIRKETSDSFDLVGHSLGCKIGTLMVAEDSSFKVDSACFVSFNNADLLGSLDFLVKVVNRLNPQSERATSQAVNTIKGLVGLFGQNVNFKPDRESFWKIAKKTWGVRKADVSLLCLEGDDGLDDGLEFLDAMTGEGGEGGEGGDKARVFLTGSSADAREGGDESGGSGGIVLSTQERSSSGTFSVSAFDHPHLAPCYIDVIDAIRSQTQAQGFAGVDGANIPSPTFGDKEQIEEIANAVCEEIMKRRT